MSTLEAARNITKRILGRDSRSPKQLDQLFESDNDTDDQTCQPWKDKAVKVAKDAAQRDENGRGESDVDEVGEHEEVAGGGDDTRIRATPKMRLKFRESSITKTNKPSKIPRLGRGRKTGKAIGKSQADSSQQFQETGEEEATVSKKKVTGITAMSEQTEETTHADQGTQLSLTSQTQDASSKGVTNSASSNVFEAIRQMRSSDSASSGTESDESGQMLVSLQRKGKGRGESVKVTSSSKTGSTTEVSGVVRPKTGKKGVAGKSNVSKGRKNKQIKRRIISSDTDSTDCTTRKQIENRQTLEDDNVIKSSRIQKQKQGKVDTTSPGSSSMSSLPEGKTLTTPSGRKKGTNTARLTGRKLITLDIGGGDTVDEFDLDYEEPQVDTKKPVKQKQRRTVTTEVDSGEELELGDLDEEVYRPAAAKHEAKATSNKVQKQTRKTGRKPQKKAVDDIEWESEELDVKENTKSKAVSKTTSKKQVVPSAQKLDRKTVNSRRPKRPTESTVNSPPKKVASSEDNDSVVGSEGSGSDQLYDIQVDDTETPSQSGRKTNARKRIIVPEAHGSHGEDEEDKDEVYGKQNRKRKAAGVREKKVSVRGRRSQMTSKSLKDMRRSVRHRVKPLAFWKLENAVYKLTNSGPVFDGVSQPLNPTPKMLRAARIKRKAPVAQRSAERASQRTESDEEMDEGDEDNEQEELASKLRAYGVVDMAQTTASVVGTDGVDKDMDILRHGDNLDMRSPSGSMPTSSDDMILARPFNHSSFSSGVVVVRCGGEKSHSVVRKSTLVFYVASGQLVIQIHHTAFYVKRGAIFVVPIGNAYSLKNVGQKEARLHFVHIKQSMQA